MITAKIYGLKMIQKRVKQQKSEKSYFVNLCVIDSIKMINSRQKKSESVISNQPEKFSFLFLLLLFHLKPIEYKHLSFASQQICENV